MHLDTQTKQDALVGATELAFEGAAKRTLERLLGGSHVDRDVNGAQGMRDFDLCTAGTVLHAVEVSSVQLSAARATRAGLERLRTQELGLTASWDVYVHEAAPPREIERKAPRLLNLLHSAGMLAFDAWRPPTEPALAVAVSELASLHIPLGTASDTQPPRLHGATFGSGSVDPANLTRALEVEASKPDNRRKLGAAPPGAERHLFLWLHDSNWYVSSLLRDPIATPPAPLLPDEIDVIWAAVSDGRGEVAALLRADRAGLTQVDPTTGRALPRQVAPGAATGPPDDPPTCTVCGGDGTWTVSTVRRHVPQAEETTEVRAWRARCATDARHWSSPGRALSALELAQLTSSGSATGDQ